MFKNSLVRVPFVYVFLLYSQYGVILGRKCCKDSGCMMTIEMNSRHPSSLVFVVPDSQLKKRDRMMFWFVRKLSEFFQYLVARLRFELSYQRNCGSFVKVPESGVSFKNRFCQWEPKPFLPLNQNHAPKSKPQSSISQHQLATQNPSSS